MNELILVRQGEDGAMVLPVATPLVKLGEVVFSPDDTLHLQQTQESFQGFDIRQHPLADARWLYLAKGGNFNEMFPFSLFSFLPLGWHQCSFSKGPLKNKWSPS